MFAEIYTLGPSIGRGGFAEVFRCHHKVTEAEFAVKVSRKKCLLPHDVANAQTEAAILRELSHPRIVKVYDVFESDSTLYVVMELVEGGQLFHKIVELDSYTEETASRLMQGVFEGVQYMHSCGVAHRDLKAENLILVGRHEVCDHFDTFLTKVKICDFGFARRFTPGQPAFTDYVGSLPYLAPEVVRLNCGGSTAPYDEKCDLWSCGVICFILLSGCFPIMGDTVPQTQRFILEAKYSFDGKVWQGITPQAKAFITSLLTLDPSQRASAEDALLDPWITGHGLPEHFSSNHLGDTIYELHEFNAHRKLKGLLEATLAVCRLQRLFHVHQKMASRKIQKEWRRRSLTGSIYSADPKTPKTAESAFSSA
eukprot:EG_transcript_13107